ncbi:PREDICTED: E3 ubiquitin-protein ligase RNF126 [Drosophila arizonae]|uniref:RING-type E3 ubiquitin transferase n=1 Tax=Drosophila arizonae TaxID=7263 RepID=A0ABM1NLZ4_DROAR|nr:PREDICTED: E3 ubiquitin-protein ligase RNF126 [Drosophila arizonae]XP_017855980.1 PREDICTED: E3 ubiquitin-protein ligase RNF126 [Drosophila arizonae]
MAEAMVVEEHPTVPKRFFCHMCNVEINIPNTDYTCPLCSYGFVEELPANAPELSASTSNSALNHDAVNSDASIGGTNAVSSGSGAGGSGMLNVESLRNDIVSLLSMRNVPNLEITIEPNRRHTNVVHLGGPSGGSVSSGSSGGASSIGGGRVRPASLDRLDNVLYDFLQSLPLAGATAEIVTGPGGSGGGGGTGHSHMFFMGNPGDYAWGREGLDTIVTQMLNQMETAGPPPLSTQRINEIPNVKISAEEVERKMQCSVCWDDFKLDESVRKLPCSHLYHENCIVPWLNLHSTCPICRKSLANDDDNDDAASIDEDYALLNNSADENGSGRASGSSNSTARAPTSTNASSQTTAAQTDQTTATAATQQRNNVFTFDDDNMFLD